MSNRALVLLLAATAVSCGKAGTYVELKLKAASGSAPAGIKKIHLQLMLGTKNDMVDLSETGGRDVTLPTSVALEIRTGEGRLTVMAMALAAQDQPLGQGTGAIDVKKDTTVTLEVPIDFGGGSDGGATDGPPGDGTAESGGGDGADARDAGDGGATDGAGGDGAGGDGGSTDGPSGDGAGGDGGSTDGPDASDAAEAGPGDGPAGDAPVEVAPPSLVMDHQPSVDFGTVPLGSASSSVTFTVSNTGGSASGSLGAAMLSGADPGEFDVVTDGCSGRMLGPTEFCTVTARFEPSRAGSVEATLGTSASPGGTASTVLKGTGTVGMLQVTPTPYDFRGVLFGSSSDATFTIRNTGTADTGAVALMVGGTDASAFTIPNTEDACTGRTLSPNATCTFVGRFTASAPRGRKTAVITASASPGGTAMAAIEGTAMAPAQLEVNPTSMDFRIVDVGVPATQIFTFTNSGDQTTGALGAPVMAGDAAFGITGNTCTGMTLAGGGTASCTVTVAFNPPAYGARSASFQVSASPGGMVSDPLSGTGRQMFTLNVTKSGDGTGTVTSTSPPGDISCLLFPCSKVYEVTTSPPTVALAASPDITSTFTGWAGSCASDPCTVVMNANRDLDAIFAIKRFTVQVTKNGLDGAMGTVTLDGTGCAPTCMKTVTYGTNVSLTAAGTAPMNGFAGWVGLPSTCTGTTTPCSFSVTADANATATISPYNVAFVSSSSSGSNLGGLTAADTTCRNLASGRFPGATQFVAYLSTDSVDAYTRLGTARGFVRPDGRPFGDTVASIRSGQIYYPMKITETGNDALEGDVFTGSNADGSRRTGYNCAAWTTNASSSMIGGGNSASGGASWLIHSSGTCNQIPSARIYCIGTRYITPLVLQRAVGRRAFLSSMGFRPGVGMSVGTADVICRTEAAAVGYCPDASNCPRFKAMLATNGASAQSRFTNPGATWVRPDGILVSANVADLWASNLLAPINQRADGSYHFSQGARLYTGASSPTTAGTAAGTCQSWSDGTSTGGAFYGIPSFAGPTFFNWTSLFGCTGTYPVYCLED